MENVDLLFVVYFRVTFPDVQSVECSVTLVYVQTTYDSTYVVQRIGNVGNKDTYVWSHVFNTGGAMLHVARSDVHASKERVARELLDLRCVTA